jgi:hypothetical protein
MTSSRGSLDEEQLEGLLEQGQRSNGTASTAETGSGGGGGMAEGLAAAVAPSAQPQSVDGVEAWQARQLSTKELKKLTELQQEDAYRCGVVSCATELADCLGTSLTDGLCESQASISKLPFVTATCRPAALQCYVCINA